MSAKLIFCCCCWLAVADLGFDFGDEAILYIIKALGLYFFCGLYFLWPKLCIVGLYYLWPSIFVTKLLNVNIGSSPIYSKNENNICIFYFECPIIIGPTQKAQPEKPTRWNPNIPEHFGNLIRIYILHFLHGSAEFH